jgi:hypothetical protein
MKLIPFTDFPLHEREAVLATLARLHIPAERVCLTRLQPPSGPDHPPLPSVALVSAPGWSRAYEGEDWIERMDADLQARAFAGLAPAAQQPHGDGSSSGPASLGAR